AVLATKLCKGGPPNKSVKLTVKGTVDSVTPTTITVKPDDGSTSQTCAIASGSPSTAHVAQGDSVEMTCQTINGALTLVHLKKRGGPTVPLRSAACERRPSGASRVSTRGR